VDDLDANIGPFICAATGCGYFDGPDVAFGDEPRYCPIHAERLAMVRAIAREDASLLKVLAEKGINRLK